MVNIGLIYGYIFLLMGLIISLYAIIISIVTPENQPIRNIRQNKWNQLVLFSFLCLSLIGTLLLFIDFFWKEAINYRMITYPGITLFADIILILHIFVGFIVIISRVEMQTVGERAGKFVIALNKKLEFFGVILFLPVPPRGDFSRYFWMFLLFFYVMLGASSLLIILSLIPIVLTKIIFENAPAF